MTPDAGTARDMGAFWDAAARENAAYFVENNLDYREPDMDRFWAQGPPVVDQLLGELEAPAIRPDDVVVEVGCGIGRLTRPLAERAARVQAFDISKEMIAQARELNPQLANVEWVVGDGTSLRPAQDGSASVVFSHVVFQHIPDPQITLGYVAEMGRVLRPGGWAAFQVSNDPSIHRPIAGWPAFKHRVRSWVGRAPKGQDNPAWLGSAVDLGNLRRVADQAGMDVERSVREGTQYCLVLLRRR